MSATEVLESLSLPDAELLKPSSTTVVAELAVNSSAAFHDSSISSDTLKRQAKNLSSASVILEASCSLPSIPSDDVFVYKLSATSQLKLHTKTSTSEKFYPRLLCSRSLGEVLRKDEVCLFIFSSYITYRHQ